MKIQGKAVEHLKNININDEWETDPKVLQDAIIKYKIHPKIDVFANQSNHQCLKYYSKEDSAFEHEIKEDFFANPMYSEISRCMKFLYYQHLNFNTNGMILTYAKTDTKWWHSYVEDRAEIHFIKGRLRFMLNRIIPRYCEDCKTMFVLEIEHCPICQKRLIKNSAPYPSCWIIYRKKSF